MYGGFRAPSQGLRARAWSKLGIRLGAAPFHWRGFASFGYARSGHETRSPLIPRPVTRRRPRTAAAREALTFDVLDDLILAHERGRKPAVHLEPGPCLGSIVELLHFCEEHAGALEYSASPETCAAKRAFEARRPVFLADQTTGFVTAQRVAYRGGDTYWDAFMFAMLRAMRAKGFPGLFSRGLVGAIDEMQNNIHDHSQASASGLIAYRVCREKVEWTVADRGIGVLTGLNSGAFPSLNDTGEALKIALTDGRSRFGGATGRGYGFRELFKALSARHGTLRFRSDDQALTIKGVSPSLSRARLQQRAQVSGFSVTVVCPKPAAS